jgi:hypothetical protein
VGIGCCVFGTRRNAPHPVPTPLSVARLILYGRAFRIRCSLKNYCPTRNEEGKLFMKLPSIKTEQSSGDPGATPKKTLWVVILSSTPVILTVVATILAGLSSSEMTQAQYHRALAAQNQSKASDQWTFFQFKRTRGQEMKMALDGLPALSATDRLDPATLRASVEQFAKDLQNVGTNVEGLTALLGPVKESLGPAGDKFRLTLNKLSQVVGVQIKEAQTLVSGVNQRLTQAGVEDAFQYLATDKLPPAKLSLLQEPRIQEALKAIDTRQSEAETAPLIGKIDEATLNCEISLAEGNAAAVEKANKPVSGVLEDLEKLIGQETRLAWDLSRSMRRLEAALDSLPAAAAVAPLRASAAKALRSAAAAKSNVLELNTDFKAAQYDYTVRRYESEARQNQKAAVLYEVQIRKASVNSESHRQRSKHFFYGMLVAQAGVTIASFSLAVKHKSVLWTLATLAGISAVAFSSYVYLYVKPG